MSSKIKVDTIENVAGSGNVSLGSGHNLVVPGTVSVTGAITGTTQTLNRSGDGDLIAFQKGGADSGSISIESSGTAFDGETGHAGLKMFLGSVGGRQNGADVDNTIDLGWTGGRFKDIYLGGGLYVGGTDAAHQFHDYEEGDRASSSVSGITASTNTVTGYYTKVGRLIVEHIYVVISGKSGGSGNPYIGLSFTPTKSVGASLVQGGSIGMNTAVQSTSFTNSGFMGVYGGNPQVYANYYNQGYVAHSDWGNGTLAFTVIYEAD